MGSAQFCCSRWLGITFILFSVVPKFWQVAVEVDAGMLEYLEVVIQNDGFQLEMFIFIFVGRLNPTTRALSL